MNRTKKLNHQDDDVILFIIVIISIIITELFDTIKCLISPTCKPSIQKAGDKDLQSSVTKPSVTGKTKNLQQLPSTNSTVDTVDQKKAAGGTTKATRTRRTASSAKSKPSKPISTTRRSTKSTNSQTLGFQQQKALGKSAMTQVEQSISQPNVLTTVKK